MDVNAPSLKVGEIKVETNQNVDLSGVADTRADIDKAFALARAVRA
jgi:osmotically-inducible protein OsmY